MWDWLFPRLCGACGRPLLKGEHGACLSCLLALPQTYFWSHPHKNAAYYRLAPHVPQLVGAFSGFWYAPGSPLREWVHMAKYQGRPYLLYEAAHFLAYLAQQALPLSELKGLLPIPISPQRLRQRGYNQAEWVARGLHDVWRLPILSGYWQRRAGGVSQLYKVRTQRWTTLQGEFVCRRPIPSPVVVVDDVLTTGATLAAAIAALPASVQVWVVTVGITRPR